MRLRFAISGQPKNAENAAAGGKPDQPTEQKASNTDEKAGVIHGQ